MDLLPNKTDGKLLPITNRRIAASEWNQLVASCMAFITAAGLTPDGTDNEQFLNAFKAIAADLELVGANTNLSNLTASGENHFAKPDLSNVSGTSKLRKLVEVYQNGTSWYKCYEEFNPSSGAYLGTWCEQGGRVADVDITVTLLKEMADTNGTVTVTVNSTTAPTTTAGNPRGGFISTTQIFVTSAQGNLPAFWKVEGYIATGA